uniref:MBOAT family protein n=1 Tax=Syphacia muris TaxID=451379 RepID=A0A0N5ARB8_9BILA
MCKLRISEELIQYAEDYPRDNSDYEWELYRYSIWPAAVTISDYPQIFSFKCIGIFSAFAATVVGLTFLCRNQLIAWTFCMIALLKMIQYINFSAELTVFYREYNFYLYGIIKILNYCIYLSRNPDKPLTAETLQRCLQYLFYPPYSMLLIVLYEDFDTQITNVENGRNPPFSFKYKSFKIIMQILTSLVIQKNKNDYFRKAAFGCIRLFFWFYAFEFILHFIYVIYFFEDTHGMIREFSPYEIVSIAYVRGELFHIKYVVIFGVNAWLASLDGMTPPQKPICISRVSRYSNMWKMFDRGLYQFLKNQVYLPLGGKKDSKYFWCRRFLALIGVFSFVLAWHGPISPYIYWVTLSAIELCIEALGKSINKTEAWKKFSDKVGPQNQRRIVSIAMLTTVTPGIFGVFFFLGNKGSGLVIFEETFVKAMKDVANFNFTIFPQLSRGTILFHMLFLNFIFSNVCLELDETLRPKIDKQAKLE